MIVYVIYVLRIAIGKSKNNAPIGLNRDGMEVLEFAFQRVQPIPRQIHVRHESRGMQPRQDSPQFAGMIGSHTPRVVIFEQAFQTLVTYRPDQSLM